MSLDELSASLSADEAAPGGGSASAAVASLGASLLIMTCNFTIGRERYKEAWELLREVREELESLRVWFLTTVDRDAEAYGRVVEAMSLPRSTDEEKTARRSAMQEALKGACDVPMGLAKRCARALDLAVLVAEKGNPNTISDTGCGAWFLHSALNGALYNVRINLSAIKDASYVEKASSEADGLGERSKETLERVASMVVTGL
jgi:formiminotetrahydrofolate cyclodeaminase